MSELEKLIDELVMQARINSDTSLKKSEEIEQAILDRDTEKDKRISELENSNRELRLNVKMYKESYVHKNRVAELEAQVKKMKCCANCGGNDRSMRGKCDSCYSYNNWW